MGDLLTQFDNEESTKKMQIRAIGLMNDKNKGANSNSPIVTHDADKAFQALGLKSPVSTNSSAKKREVNLFPPVQLGPKVATKNGKPIEKKKEFYGPPKSPSRQYVETLVVGGKERQVSFDHPPSDADKMHAREKFLATSGGPVAEQYQSIGKAMGSIPQDSPQYMAMAKYRRNLLDLGFDPETRMKELRNKINWAANHPELKDSGSVYDEARAEFIKLKHAPTMVDPDHLYGLPARPDDQSKMPALDGSGISEKAYNQRVFASTHPQTDVQLAFGDNLEPGVYTGMGAGRAGLQGPIQDPVDQWIRKHVSATGLNSQAFYSKVAQLRKEGKTDEEILEYIQKPENAKDLQLQSQIIGALLTFLPGTGAAQLVDGLDQATQGYDQKVKEGSSPLGALGLTALDLAKGAVAPLVELPGNLLDPNLSPLGKLSATANAGLIGHGLFHGIKSGSQKLNAYLREGIPSNYSPIGWAMNSLFGENVGSSKIKNDEIGSWSSKPRNSERSFPESTHLKGSSGSPTLTVDLPNFSVRKYGKLGSDRNVLSWKDIEQFRDPDTGKIFATQLHADRQGAHPYVTDFGRELPQTGGFENSLQDLNYGRSGYSTSSRAVANKIIRGMNGQESLAFWHAADPSAVLTSPEGVRNYFHELYDMRDFGGIPEAQLLSGIQRLFGDRTLKYNGLQIHPSEIGSLALFEALLSHTFKTGNVFKDRVTNAFLTSQLGLFDGNTVAHKMNSPSYAGLSNGSVIAGSILEPRLSSAAELGIPDPRSYSQIIPGTGLGNVSNSELLSKIFAPAFNRWSSQANMRFENYMNLTEAERIQKDIESRSLKGSSKSQWKQDNEMSRRAPRESDFNSLIRLSPKRREVDESALAQALSTIHWRG